MASFSSGVPMVKIDGGSIRSLREERGLTQLYLATSVEVTTDTISRWENKRYPQIKKENAIRLAEALDVELDAILDHHEDEVPLSESAPLNSEPADRVGPPESSVPLPASGSSAAPAILGGRISFAIGFVVLVLILGGIFWQSLSPDKVTISAERITPAHIVPGLPFPVIVQIDTGPEASSFILKEIIPANCTLIKDSSPGAVVDQKSGEIKWITKAKEPVVRVGYMLQTKEQFKVSDQIVFSGSVTQRKAKGNGMIVGGRAKASASFFHWADTDMDGTIDDEEVLAVYDDYDEIEGLSLDMEQIEDIWFGSGYAWDKDKKEFVVDN